MVILWSILFSLHAGLTVVESVDFLAALSNLNVMNYLSAVANAQIKQAFLVSIKSIFKTLLFSLDVVV